MFRDGFEINAKLATVSHRDFHSLCLSRNNLIHLSDFPDQETLGFGV